MKKPSSPSQTNPIAAEKALEAVLRRELGVTGATMMGLGSMLGTGVFVSIGIGAGIAGAGVLLAIALAAVLAACNALSSAQLAANHPVAGGTYEYGHRWLNSDFGFTAGWMFILAKSASAATAALGFAGYLIFSLDPGSEALLVPVAVVLVIVLSAVVMGGLRNSSRVNMAFVALTLLALLSFVAIGIPRLAAEHFHPFISSPAHPGGHPAALVLQATALMFVAYTGYGRIATLGEEVHEPRRTIPRAILLTLGFTALLYLAVGLAGIGTVGAGVFHAATEEEAAPLEVIAKSWEIPGLPELVAVGAMTAMLGVLLNLLLGLSRMVMALARRRDLPAALARLNAARDTPARAVCVVGLLIVALTLIGDIRVTWSFSAFTVLIYYAITNLAALRLPKGERLYPPVFAWMGLVGCLFLAFWIETRIWIAGLGLILIGLAWHRLCLRARRVRSP